MALDGLTNKVLRLLLAQNNLAISGTREQLLEWPSEISPELISAATDEPPQKRTLTGHKLSNPNTSTSSSDTHVDLTGGQDVIPNKGIVNPANDQNPGEAVAPEINKMAAKQGASPPQQSIHPSRPADHSQPQQPPTLLLSQSTCHQMIETAFIASLLTQASASHQPVSISTSPPSRPTSPRKQSMPFYEVSTLNLTRCYHKTHSLAIQIFLGCPFPSMGNKLISLLPGVRKNTC